MKRFAPRYYIEHAKHFARKTTSHPDAPIWSITPDKGFATIHVIEAPKGLIILDTGLNEEQMRPVAEKIKSLGKKPIKAVIYTHPHADHTGGVAAFISQDQVDKGEVEVIADAYFMQAYASENAATGPLMGQRAALMCSLRIKSSLLPVAVVTLPQVRQALLRQLILPIKIQKHVMY